MKILMISRGFPSEKEPQDGCFELDQAKALQKLGHEVIMMSVDCRLKREWRKIGITRGYIDGIRTYKMYYFPTSIIRRINYKLSSWIDKEIGLRLFKTIQHECGKFDVIHAHFLPCIYWGVYIKEYCNTPLVGTEHWSKLNVDKLEPYILFLGNRTYQYVDGLISVCQSLRSRVYNHFNIDSYVIHNMIGEDFCWETNKTQLHRQFQFISIGNLIQLKGFDLLINAFAKSDLSDRDVKLIIVGEGPEHKKLQQQIDKTGLNQYISLLGHKSKSEIVELLKGSDVYISSSRSENFSVAVLEALSTGLPVIATICGGIKECINEDNGLLVPIESEDDLASAMVRMYNDYTNYKRDWIRHDCLEKYSPEVIARQIEVVYAKVLNKNV